MEKTKILVVNNGSRECKIGLVEPHLKLYDTYPDLFEIDIESELDATDLHYFESYDYVVYHRCIGDSYDKCKNLIQYLKETNTKTVLYVDEYWQLPKEHPYYKQFNERKFHERISNNIRLVDKVFCFHNERLLENIASLNRNCYMFEDSPALKEVTTEWNDTYKIGIRPNLYDIENIKLLTDIHKYFKSYENIQFILIGFDPRGTTNQYNHFTGEVTEVVKKPQDTVWAAYEKIITNDYKICSKEYKEFLLKFLPNNKYDGDISKEPYKRVWYNEIKDNNCECYCLLKPQINNRYNELKYDIDIRECLNSYFSVISTFGVGVLSPKKTNIPKQWAECIKQIMLYDKDQPFYTIKEKRGDSLKNIKLMYKN